MTDASAFYNNVVPWLLITWKCSLSLAQRLQQPARLVKAHQRLELALAVVKSKVTYMFSELFFIPLKDKPAMQRRLLLMTTRKSLVPLLIPPEVIYFRVKNKIGNKMKESPYLFNLEPCIHSYLNNLVIK